MRIEFEPSRAKLDIQSRWLGQSPKLSALFLVSFLATGLAGCAADSSNPENDGVAVVAGDAAETVDTTAQALKLSFPVDGSVLAQPIDEELSKDKVVWESGRRRVEYRDISADDFTVSVDTNGSKALVRVSIPKIRIKGKFIRDRRLIRDKIRDVRMDMRDVTGSAEFDISRGVRDIRLVRVNNVSIRDLDFEGEGLVLEIVERILERNDGPIRRVLERELTNYLRKHGEDFVKRAL